MDRLRIPNQTGPMEFEEFKRQLGARVQDFRRRRKLTQEELGEKAELSEETVSSIERGVNVPRIETIFRIAEALDVSLSELFDVAAGTPAPKETQAQIDRLLALIDGQRGDVIDAIVGQAEILTRLEASKAPSSD